jgi:uncharacterized protein
MSLPRVRLNWIAIALVLLAWLAPSASAAEPKFPPLSGRVVDQAGILSASTQTDLTNLLAANERATGDQVVVVTLPSLQGDTIENVGYQLGRYWGIGQKGKDNGVILLIAPKEHKVRIEVGYGLEGTLTDAISRVIIERDIAPAFKRSDFDAGALAGVQSITKVLSVGANQASADSADTGMSGAARSADVGNSMEWLGIELLAGSLFIYLLLYLFGTHYHAPMDKDYLLYRSRNRARRGPFAGLPPLYGGGFGGGGFGGGGGFSGGGGSFGGGGASGGW